MNPLAKLSSLLARALGFAACCFALTSAHAQNYTAYDVIVPVSAPGVRTVLDGNGRILPTDRSYIIGIAGGARGPILLKNWTAPNPRFPIIVVNQHGTGRVSISDTPTNPTTGLTLDNCTFVRLLGNNDPAYYQGIEVAQASGSQRGISVGDTSSYIEVAFTEIHHTGFAGLMMKTDPLASRPETWAANFEMREVWVHDNYIHDTSGEGMYLGYTGWGTDKWPEVPGYEGHEIKGIRVEYNLIERTGWDGLQVSSAPDDPLATNDDALVHDNVLYWPSTKNAVNQNAGIVVGGGTGGRVFNNIVIANPTANGPTMSIFGRGYNTVFNNLLVGGSTGIFADNRGTEDPRRTIPGSFQSIYNNTIVAAHSHAFWTLNEVTVNAYKNNVAVVLDPAAMDVVADGGSTVDAVGNLLLRAAAADFVNPAEYDYRLLGGSAAIDAGVSLASLPAGEGPVLDDAFGVARPQARPYFIPPGRADKEFPARGKSAEHRPESAGAGHGPGMPNGQGEGLAHAANYEPAYDAGYAEAGALSVWLVCTPPADNAGGSIKASALGGAEPYSFAWSNGATTPTISGVARGVYSVTVTDANGVQQTKSVYLADGAAMGQPVRVLPADEVAVPVFSPASSRFNAPQLVTLSTATPDAIIRYTTDGSAPTETSEPFVAELLVSQSSTIKAAAFKAGFKTSRVSEATYVIDNGPANVKFTGVTATASSYTSTNTPAKALDGDLATAWASNGDGQWLQFDLHVPRRLGYFTLTFVSADTRYYTFDVLVSLDGATWTTILPAHQNPNATGLQVYDIPDEDPVRYVRFVCHGSTYNASLNNIAEVEFYGGETNSAIAPMIFAQPQSQTVATGSNVTFSVDAFANPAPTYQWYVDDVLIPGAAGALYSLPNVQMSDAGTYRVVVSNSSGSLASENATLAVLPPPLGLVLQAENAVLVGAAVRSNQAGYTGTGFADYINATNDYVEWTASIPTPGTRALTFRYASTGAARVLSLAVNGVVADGAVSFASSGGATIWVLKTIYVTLPAGTVKIRLTAISTSGPNIDYLQID
jgi:hypothetical protein